MHLIEQKSCNLLLQLKKYLIFKKKWEMKSSKISRRHTLKEKKRKKAIIFKKESQELNVAISQKTNYRGKKKP